MIQDLIIKYDKLADTIKNIEISIREIETNLNNVKKAMTTLDNNKWTGKQKNKIDNEFIPYLEKISRDYPSYLRENNAFLRNSVIKYQLLDKKLQDVIDKGDEV